MNLVRRLGVSGLAIGLSLLMGGAAVNAGGLPAHSGTYGRHYLADNQDNPGVLCRYVGDGNFRSLRVDSPFVYGTDRTTAADRQTVGWAFRVQAKSDSAGAHWTTIYTSSVRKATATDERDAAFSRRSHTFTAAQVPTSNSYRVQILMTWYTGSSVTGRARHTVEWYHGGSFEPSFGPGGYCPGFQL